MTRKEKVLANRNRFIQKHKEAGLCVDCPNEASENRSRCSVCLARLRSKKAEKRAEAVANGKCGACFKAPKMGRHRMCEECYFRDVAWNRLGTSKRWAELRDIFTKQGGKCALSGLPITLGKDCELDHIVPGSKGGTDENENLQWVLMVVNRMKDNLTEAEFFGLVEGLYRTMKAKR